MGYFILTLKVGSLISDHNEIVGHVLSPTLTLDPLWTSLVSKAIPVSWHVIIVS